MMRKMFLLAALMLFAVRADASGGYPIVGRYYKQTFVERHVQVRYVDPVTKKYKTYTFSEITQGPNRYFIVYKNGHADDAEIVTVEVEKSDYDESCGYYYGNAPDPAGNAEPGNGGN